MGINFPLKQMTSWKSGNIAPLLLAITYVALPFLLGKSIPQSTFMFGMMFFAVTLIKAKSSPTVLGSLFTALLGLTYFFSVFSTMSDATLWTISIILFAMALVWEIGLFKFGPSNSKAKALTIVPICVLGFSLLLGLAGVNPLIKFNWNVWPVALGYFAVMVYCWLYVLDYGGYRPFKGKNIFWMNIMAVAALVLGFLGVMQGWGIILW